MYIHIQQSCLCQCMTEATKSSLQHPPIRYEQICTLYYKCISLMHASYALYCIHLLLITTHSHYLYTPYTIDGGQDRASPEERRVRVGQRHICKNSILCILHVYHTRTAKKFLLRRRTFVSVVIYPM